MAMLALAVGHGCDVTVAHVDHGLRAESPLEGEVVAAAASRFGARFRSTRVHVDPGPNLEARVRAARHTALPSDALLAHTADDQAETILLNLLRGAGIDGLAGMCVDRRPLRALRRHETRALCDALALDVVDDPMNDDPTFRRVRVRHELVPLLSDIAERDVVPVLARQAELLRGAAVELDRRAAALDPTDADALRDATPALARQALRTWLRGCSDERHPPDAATVERVLAVVVGSTRATDVGRGWRVERHARRLVLVPPSDTLG
jgi:tRNA(Ile)-lysidine synthase